MHNPGRPTDLVYLAANSAKVIPQAVRHQQTLLDMRGAGGVPLQIGERGVDVAYELDVTPWLSVSPNIQYISDPGAFFYRHIPNATVVGLQTQIKF